MTMRPSTIVTCQSVSVYEGSLTYGRKYTVLESNADNIRIENDAGRRRWYPRSCFDLSGAEVPTVTDIRIDDEPPSEAPVEVTIRLSDGQQRWCWFATPAMLEQCGDRLPDSDVRIHYGRHLIVAGEISEQVIESAVRHLESQGVLIAHSLPLERTE